MRIRLVVALGFFAATLAGAQSVDDRAELRRLNQEATAAHERKDLPGEDGARELCSIPLI